MNAALFISTHCHFCVDSAPFYRQVADAQHGHLTEVALSVLSVESAGEMKEFLLKEHIAVDRVYQVPSSIGLRGTPTLLIVDANGIVQRAFVGVLDESRQHEVLQIIRTGEL